MKKVVIVLLLQLFSMIAEAGEHKKTLILIGYADDNRLSGAQSLFQRPHHHSVSFRTELAVRAQLANSGYEEETKNHFVNHQGEVVDIMNSNILCKNEVPGGINLRTNTGCIQQEELSNSIMKFLNSNALTSYERFIYIGHAREGLGLGVGPFIDTYTYKFRFYNSVEVGSLKEIIFASCDSNHYYGHLSKHVNFKGINGKLMWIKDLLPFVLKEI